MPADTISSTSLGRNLTPLDLVIAAREMLGGLIELDYCSDSIADTGIWAVQYYDFINDGFKSLLAAGENKGGLRPRTSYLNPPGKSWTGGDTETRSILFRLLGELDEAKFIGIAKPIAVLEEKIKSFTKEHNIKQVSAADWYRAVYAAWLSGHLRQVVWLLYRGGSMGSLDPDMLRSSYLCMTNGGASSPAVNGSGRLSFDSVINGGRVPQSSNTQASIIGLLPDRDNRDNDIDRFYDIFGRFGVCFHPMVVPL